MPAAVYSQRRGNSENPRLGRDNHLTIFQLLQMSFQCCRNSKPTKSLRIQHEVFPTQPDPPKVGNRKFQPEDRDFASRLPSSPSRNLQRKCPLSVERRGASSGTSFVPPAPTPRIFTGGIRSSVTMMLLENSPVTRKCGRAGILNISSNALRLWAVYHVMPHSLFA